MYFGYTDLLKGVFSFIYGELNVFIFFGLDWLGLVAQLHLAWVMHDFLTTSTKSDAIFF